FGISKNKVTINIGDSYDLDVTGTEKIPRWTTWGINKVNIDRDGVVTGIRAGKTTVSARIGLIVRKCTVTVVDPTITLNKKAATIYTGGNSAKMVQLKATSKGAAKGIVWNTSDSNVAIVDENGKVTSVAEGTAYITATANKETAVCEVTVKETRIRLDHDSITLSTKGTGSSILLRPVITGSKKEVKWTTSDKKVAIVKNGKVTGKGNGTVVVTATANGVSAACKVKVVTGSVSVNEEKALLYVGETKQLKTNAGKKDVVKWTSSDSAVATVDEKGKVTAVGAGSAKISANCFDTTDTCVVTVKETETKIGENTIELKTKGADRKFKLGYEVIGRKSAVKWTTSDKKVATVSNGTVTAKKAGTAVITATANGVSDTVFVTVKDYDPTIRLNRNEYVLYTGKGNIVTLKATVNGPLKKAIWKTSNEAVATVSTKGKVKGLSEGQAVITASANGVSAECLITVIQSETIPEKENVFLRKGEKTEIPADIIGEKQNITYKTTNKKVAT
ncbi:MAG: Ig-like domain-containing protein, partial [Clostridia bacterium]|nr:Ig-like domain-containing protein [Clostridia bacterium]